MEHEVEIREEALKLMKLRIMKLEKDNAKDRKLDDKKMVDEIKKIIEEEMDL